MQSSESAETLGVEPYRLVSLGDPIAHRIECLTTHDDLLLVGTTDSKIALYRVQNMYGESGAAAASVRLLHEVVDVRRQPVRSLTTIGDHHVLALVGDAIVLYSLSSDAARPLQLREVTAITGLKDTISFHVKQHKGVVTLAALQRRRLTLYEATFNHFEFLLKETVALPDGVRTFGWMGRSFLLGGRKEYFLSHTASATTTVLYPTPRSGAAPLVLPMAPVPELLVAGEGCGMRALLSDGSEVPGDSRVSWSSSPASMLYEHPYVISHHTTGPHTLQVRLPLLSTLDTASRQRNSLLQYIDLPKVSRISQCCCTDYDCPMPTAAAKPHALARHPIIVSDTSGRLFHLRRSAAAIPAEQLAARSLFAAADLLCQLCPHEVQEDTVRRVVTAGALHRFCTLKDYPGCFHDLSKIEADPRVALRLFPGFLSEEEATRCPPLPPTAAVLPSAVTTAALPALADYLQSRRIALLLQGASVLSTEAGSATLACVDRALVLAWCALKSEAPLLALLQSENGCALDDTAAILQARGQWVALVVHLEAHSQYETAADHLQRLATAEPLVRLAPVATRFFQQRSTLPTSDDVYVPQCTLEAWAAAAVSSSSSPHDGGAGAAAATTVTPPTATAALVALATSLTFFRRRSLATQSALFSSHLTWVLGCVPPENGLRIFLSATNVVHYASALRLLQSYEDAPGATTRQELVVSFLHLMFADARLHVADDTLYDVYWQGLGDLLFAAPPERLSEAARHVYRSRLDEFLLTSPHINLEAARHYFNTAGIRDACVAERALVYRRQGAHRSAVEMFATEADDMAGAKAYAGSVRSEDGGDAYTALLELLLRPQHGAPRVAEALSILNTCDGVDAALVLPMLPDDLPFGQLSAFLLHAFRDAATTYHMSAIEGSVLHAKLLQAEETRLRETARSTVLQDSMVCPVCQRRLRPDRELAVYPDGLLVHHGCVTDEHVCPATHRDYRYTAYSLLEEL